MKVVPVALVVVLLAWVMFICAATTTSSEITRPKSPPPPRPRPSPPPPPKSSTIELDLKGVSETTYSDLIATLRRELEDPEKPCFGIPMLREPPQSDQYVLIKFISAERRNSIVLAINKKKDIYVEGYTYNDGNQARCFKDTFGKCNVMFPNVANPEEIPYTGNYMDLESNAKTKSRSKVSLGTTVLGSSIDKISGTNPPNFAQEEAKLLLIAIQMVTEAVRFKYIEEQVKKSIPIRNGFNPDPKVISLENKWSKLSKAIAHADEKTKKFESKYFVQIDNAIGGGSVEVKDVETIKPDMGLLKYEADCKLLKWLLDDNVPVSAQ